MDRLLTFAEKVKSLVDQTDPDLRDTRLFVVNAEGDKRFRIADIEFDPSKAAVVIKLQ